MPIRLLRHVFAMLLLLALCARPSSAHMELRALLDLDDDPATGCTVATPEGPFAGVEIVATSEVVTDIVPVVERIELLDCHGGVTEVEVAPGTKGGVPYAVGLGAGGFDAIETFVPLAGLPGAAGRPIRVGFTATEPELGAADALLTADGRPGGAAIRVPRGSSVVAVPTLGEWGLLALTLAMAMAGAIALRRRGSRTSRTFAIALLVLGGGLSAFQVARATLPPDGDLSAWTLDLLRAIDVDDPSAIPPAAADGSEGANLLRAYGAVADGVLYLRVDVDLSLAPILRSSGHSTFIPGGGPVAVDGLMQVADFDDTQLQGGTVMLLSRPDGASETLAVNTAGTAITAVWDEPTTTFTLSGADSLAHYQQVLRSVTYDNSTPVPQVGARTVIFIVRDDNAAGVLVGSSVRIEASARNPG